MADQLLTIERYKFQPQAETARIALEQAGIPAFLQGLFGSNTGISIGVTSGWIELQVEPSCAAEARALLESTPGLLWEDTPDDSNLDDNKCLACGAAMPAKSTRCPGCGWSFLDQPEEEPVVDQETDEIEISPVSEMPRQSDKIDKACQKCGSAKIIPHLEILDQGQYSDGRLQAFVGYTNPEALLFKGRVYAHLRLNICGECGNTELVAENPKALYEAYLALISSETENDDTDENSP